MALTSDSVDKIRKIVELLDGKGSILIRNSHEGQPNEWFVHCHWNWSSLIQDEVSETEKIKKVIFKSYVTDLEVALEEIIEKLGGNK